MFKRNQEFGFSFRGGEAVVKVSAKLWAKVGQKHTRRNQRKAAQFYRFREGLA